MVHRSLKRAAVQFVLGLAEMDDLIDAAHAALDDEVYSYSLGELATQYEPTPEASNRLFAAAINELRVAIPNREQCLTALIEDCVVAILEGSKEPLAALRDIHLAELTVGYAELLRPWIDHYHSIEDATSYFEYENSMRAVPGSDPEIDRRTEACVQHARTWCRERWRPLLQDHWLTPTVVGLARAVREDRAFDRLPILADALQEAGCENEEILGHLRQPGGHVRGCYLTDLLLEDRRPGQ